MATLSTHVLDTSRGLPAAGVAITLRSSTGDELADGVSDADGRADLGAGDLPAGEYRLRFDTAAYFSGQQVSGFYPEVVVMFRVEGDGHVHVPLLLSPFGYSTYRGS